MKTNSYKSTKKCGFTLMELLIVVAVIVILAGLLLPVLISARKRSAVARCQNSIRQLGINGLSYFLDYDIPANIRIADLGPSMRSDVIKDASPPYISECGLPVACILVPIPEPPSPNPLAPPVDGAPPSGPSPGLESSPGSSSGEEASSTVKNRGGCPKARENPAYALDPDNQPRYRSYGILKYNLGKSLVDAWPWLFSESDFNEIENKSDLAGYRHDARVNVFFSDGHAEFLPIDSIVFPEVPEDAE